VPNDANETSERPRELAWWRVVLGILMIVVGPIVGLVAYGIIDPSFDIDIRFGDPYRTPEPLGETVYEFDVHRDERSANPLWAALFGVSISQVNVTEAVRTIDAPGRYGIYVHWTEDEGNEDTLSDARQATLRAVSQLEFRAVKGPDGDPIEVHRLDHPGEQEWREKYGRVISFTALSHRFELSESAEVTIGWARPTGWTHEELEFLIAPIPESPHPFDWTALATPVALFVVVVTWVIGVLLIRSGFRVRRDARRDLPTDER